MIDVILGLYFAPSIWGKVSSEFVSECEAVTICGFTI